MQTHRLRSIVTIATLLAAAGAGVTFAQGTVAPQGQSQGEIGVQARPALTAQEQLAEADAIVRRAGQLAERLSKMLDESRREKDIMRANCLNRKLTEVNANTRNVEGRSKALKDAAAVGDDARRSHEFTVLTVLSQKLNALDQEATQCLGQSVYEPGASQVITTVPNNVLVGTEPATVPGAPPLPPAVNVPPSVSGMN